MVQAIDFFGFFVLHPVSGRLEKDESSGIAQVQATISNLPTQSKVPGAS
jgi:hypothetical protein